MMEDRIAGAAPHGTNRENHCGWRTPMAPHTSNGIFGYVDGHVRALNGPKRVYQPGLSLAPEIPTPDFSQYEGGGGDIWLIGKK